ncbi:hypothetical protein HYC85_000295 [Camellia sinensis]|uniref:PGG domain-containing protein n=1 Tax=Camellia sinensis TaxID=4442 RepID=A0A7J7I3P3_CAMSI|nr:hypothetical protein HYC85_000295 [Camellia sinensis]
MPDKDLNDDDFFWVSRNFEDHQAQIPGRSINWKKGTPGIITSVVKSLLQKKRLVQKIDLDKNAKNLEGRTALDIATTVLNPGEVEREIKEALDHAGALKSTSLPEDYRFAEFFKSPQMRIERFTRLLFYQGRELTMEMRNAILVVAVLIATATFQAILSPPGGIVRGTGDNNNLLSTNENHINATIMSTNTNNDLIPTNNMPEGIAMEIDKIQSRCVAGVILSLDTIETLSLRTILEPRWLTSIFTLAYWPRRHRLGRGSRCLGRDVHHLGRDVNI